MRPLRDDDPPGTRVVVVLDDGTSRTTRTRSELRRLGGRARIRVVVLEHKTGVYRADRVQVFEEGDEP